MNPERAIPLLRVADVSRSVAWYRDVLGFAVDAFPDDAPHVFAVLKKGPAEIMLRHSKFGREKGWEDWDLRIPLSSGIVELHARLSQERLVSRSLERMPYCDTEFDVRDPDGYVICFSQDIGEAIGVAQRKDVDS
jgi:catechol 2,3-dioxygenase-like lactoylglutathione lyase family enzyme